MKNIIEELYYGRFTSFVEIPIKSKQLDEKVKQLKKIEETLMTEFPDCKELYENCLDKQHEITEITNCERFILGFRTGVQFAKEILKPIE